LVREFSEETIMIDLDYFIKRLSSNMEVFEGLTSGLLKEQATWKPRPEKWSIVEVINHLYDEERDDFRKRLDLMISHPGEEWPKIDPPGWAVEREYIKRDLQESLENFLNERRESLKWIGQLRDVNWQATYNHPLGPIQAGDLMSSWLAHDYLHIRQLTRLHWEYTSHIAPSFSTDYAGEWIG
jgi:hypothetical protein